MALSTVTVSCRSGEEKESTLEGTASKAAQRGPLKNRWTTIFHFLKQSISVLFVIINIGKRGIECGHLCC